MIIVDWNVRGINKVYKHQEFSSFGRKNNVSLIAVLENRVREGMTPRIIKKTSR